MWSKAIIMTSNDLHALNSLRLTTKTSCMFHDMNDRHDWTTFYNSYIWETLLNLEDTASFVLGAECLTKIKNVRRKRNSYIRRKDWGKEKKRSAKAKLHGSMKKKRSWCHVVSGGQRWLIRGINWSYSIVKSANPKFTEIRGTCHLQGIDAG